jgi:BirA family transcriptional regulator, biotin operon repressor / biotin---[acetyl-CoA-carboxylase] ligase
MTTKEEILNCLRANGGYVSGEELCGQLNVSRTAIWKNINTLRDCGYEIESATNRGYKLVSCPDAIRKEEIEFGLNTAILAKKIYCYNSIDSTNEEAKRQAVGGAPNGSLFIAEQQSGGKGRLGRTWTSPAGTGLWFSVLLRPELIPSQVTIVTLLAGLAVCNGIRTYTDCPAMIKWPNDVVIGNRKVCGILTEMAAEIDRIEYLAVGIGVNVNIPSFPEELRIKATSLLLETGETVFRIGLLQEILLAFETLLKEDQTSGNDASLNDYKNLCVSLNRKVGFTRNNQPFSGTAVDISQDGELIVQCDDGSRIPVSSGEVTVQGIYGQ